MSQTYCLNVTFLAESVLIGRVDYLRLEQRKASIVWCETYTPWLARSFLGIVILPLWSAASKPSLERFITPFNWKLCHSAHLGIKPRYCKAFCGEKSSFPVLRLLPASSRVASSSLQGLTCGKMGCYFSFYVRTLCLEPLPGADETREQSLPPSQPWGWAAAITLDSSDPIIGRAGRAGAVTQGGLRSIKWQLHVICLPHGKGSTSLWPKAFHYPPFLPSPANSKLSYLRWKGKAMQSWVKQARSSSVFWVKGAITWVFHALLSLFPSHSYAFKEGNNPFFPGEEFG